jgi:hypothetical protein
MPKFTANPRTVRAIQWTGAPLNDELVASLKEVCGDYPHEIDRHGVLRISDPHGTVSIFPALPEHEHAGNTIPATPGEWAVLDESGHVHKWTDAAFHAAFG